MPIDLSYLQGKKFCLVLAQKTGDDPSKARLRTMHGRADFSREGVLSVVSDKGDKFAVPASCYHQVLQSDGTALLEDAEYYVICHVHQDIEI